MADPGVRPTTGVVASVSRVAQLALLVAFVLVWIIVLLPNTALAWLREESQRLSSAINRVEQVYPPVDMVHVVLFFVLGLLVAMAFPAMRRAVQAWALVALAAATEVAQIWVPGRSAGLDDFAVDILGGSLGLMLGWCMVLILASMGDRK